MTSGSFVTYLRFLRLNSLSLLFTSLIFTIIDRTFPTSNLPIRYKKFNSCLTILFTSCRTLELFLQLSNSFGRKKLLFSGILNTIKINLFFWVCFCSVLTSILSLTSSSLLLMSVRTSIDLFLKISHMC